MIKAPPKFTAEQIEYLSNCKVIRRYSPVSGSTAFDITVTDTITMNSEMQAGIDVLVRYLKDHDVG